MNLYQFYKPFAFALDPEMAHNASLKMASKAPFSARFFCDPNLCHHNQYDLSLSLGDKLKWKSPVGLAAGLDKNGEAIDFFSRLNFGAIEVGTVTPKAQAGNQKPRMFRIVEKESLLNRMGFNNHGAKTMSSNLKRADRFGKCLGVNLGKNKTTPADLAANDYLSLYQDLHQYSDYMVVNVSSPNTPGLRDLQKVDALVDIFETLQSEREKHPVPLFLKISPDLNVEDLDSILEVCEKFNLYGIISTNTTIAPEYGQGGVSGKLLLERSRKMREILLKKVKGSSLEVVGVGGFSNFDDVLEFWKAGGRAFQIYTAFIYQGPWLIDQILKETIALLEKNQLKSLTELLCQIDNIELS